jgi:hypothetical protein
MSVPSSAQRDADAQEQRALMGRDITDLKAELADARNEIANVRKDITKLLNAWEAASMGLTVIKWLAGVGSGVAAIWAIFSNWPDK